MTNEEARSILIKTEVMCVSGKVAEWEKAQRLACDALKENTKLKKENDRLSSDNAWLVLNKSEKEFENIDLLEENAKLKAEIEQLKEDSKIVVKELVTQIREIDKLKSELEQSVKLQEVLLKATWGSEWSRCYMCDNSMKNITLDGKNNGCDGNCYHSAEYTKEDLLDKIKSEIDITERTGVK